MDCCTSTRIGRISTHITYTIVPVFTDVRRRVTTYKLSVMGRTLGGYKIRQNVFCLCVCYVCLHVFKWPTSTWGWSYPQSWGWLFWSCGGALWSHGDSPLSRGDCHPGVTEAVSGLVEAHPAWAQLGFPFFAKKFFSRNNGALRKRALFSEIENLRTFSFVSFCETEHRFLLRNGRVCKISFCITSWMKRLLKIARRKECMGKIRPSKKIHVFS